MTKMTGLDAFYNESEDKIWFGNLISELARLNNENERVIAAAILSNYRLSKTKPDTLGGLGFYQFDWVSGFTTNEDFEKQCVEFLGLLAMGHEYRESPIPGEEGTFNVRKGEDFLYHDDEDDWYGFYDSFYFKRSELVSFFPELEDHNIDEPIAEETESGSLPSDWRGKNTAWKMIAGLAIALYESSEDVRKNGKLNQSAVCEKAANNIAKYSEEYNDTGMTMDNLRTLLKKTLQRHAPNFLGKITK